MAKNIIIIIVKYDDNYNQNNYNKIRTIQD